MNSKDTANDKKTIAHVIRIVDDYTLIIDAGTNQGLKIGDKVQVYDILDEIFDPSGKCTTVFYIFGFDIFANFKNRLKI